MLAGITVRLAALAKHTHNPKYQFSVFVALGLHGVLDSLPCDIDRTLAGQYPSHAFRDPASLFLNRTPDVVNVCACGQNEIVNRYGLALGCVQPVMQLHDSSRLFVP